MNEITVHAPSSGRAAYAVVPDSDDPVILQLDGNLARVLEISAVGFSASKDAAKPGRRYPFSMDLPTYRRPLSGYVDVLPDIRDGELTCRFVDLSEEQTDALHQYVLARQKSALRALRGGDSFASSS